LPTLTPEAGAFTIGYSGGSCGGGSVSTTVFTGDGNDHYWMYLVVGDPPSGGAKATVHRTLPSR
jgi:hypothetical protein